MTHPLAQLFANIPAIPITSAAATAQDANQNVWPRLQPTVRACLPIFRSLIPSFTLDTVLAMYAAYLNGRIQGLLQLVTQSPIPANSIDPKHAQQFVDFISKVDAINKAGASFVLAPTLVSLLSPLQEKLLQHDPSVVFDIPSVAIQYICNSCLAFSPDALKDAIWREAVNVFLLARLQKFLTKERVSLLTECMSQLLSILDGAIDDPNKHHELSLAVKQWSVRSLHALLRSLSNRRSRKLVQTGIYAVLNNKNEWIPFLVDRIGWKSGEVAETLAQLARVLNDDQADLVAEILILLNNGIIPSAPVQ